MEEFGAFCARDAESARRSCNRAERRLSLAPLLVEAPLAEKPPFAGSFSGAECGAELSRRAVRAPRKPWSPQQLRIPARPGPIGQAAHLSMIAPCQ